MAGAIGRMDIYRTAIPMRTFEHAEASRSSAEAVVVRVEFDDGRCGWGECLPRQYVTGESLDGVVDDLDRIIWPACRAARFDKLADAEVVPLAAPDGRCINSAACAFSLAACGHLLGPADAAIRTRVSGVLGSADPSRTARTLRLMRLFGLRDFKLKLGFGEQIDRDNLQVVGDRIGKAVAAGRCTLRVDVNGGWDTETTPERTSQLEQYGVCVVEQPVFCSAGELVDLARRCALPLMADESLLTEDDAETLAAEPQRVWWNIRISKNGGPFRAASLARRAAETGVPFVVGCMVGESSILSAAQRRLLQQIPQPRFVEGNYGRFLLADDLTRKSLRFGCGGRLKRLGGSGLGIDVDPKKLARYGRLAATLRA